jgi:type VI secretion system secreted protein VgrG
VARLQESREIEITTPLGDDVLLFQRMTATEQLGRLFEYQLDVVSRDANIKLDDLLGQNVTVRLKIGDESRYFNGHVSRFCFIGLTENFYSYQMTLRPWLWFLTRTADCRIFQNQKVPDIIKKIFRDQGFSDFEEQLSATYRDWEYCVQYRETDFNFVSRLMEQEGLYYYFTHEDGKHTLVLADSIEAHEATPDYEEVPYYPYEETQRRERDHIFDWFVAQEVQPGTYALNDFDFEKPKADLNAKLKQPYSHSVDDYEVYDYPGEYLEKGDGDEYVRKRIEELHAQYEQVQGQGNARGLYVGGLFSLIQYPRDDQNKEYLITSATYELKSDEYGSTSSTGAEQIFMCSFTAIDSVQPYRAPRITPKPVVQGPQTAIVVGPGGQEIYTEKHGRVKVQFHWDREGASDENSSCWIRVSHPTAGKGWGAVQIPRIGQEVIVDFLEGDPDRPIITGRVYNANSMPPYDLPNQGMVAGMKSNSTPGGGGYNEMIMDDTKGNELIRIHAQYNMDSTIEHDQTWTINNNRTTTVAVNDSETVGNNQTISVGANQSTTVGSNQSISVGANKSENVAAAKSMAIGAAYQVSVGAAMNETVGAAKAEEIGANKSVNVGASSSETVGKNKSLDAGENITEAAGKDISVQSGKKMIFAAGDDFGLKGDKKGAIEMADELTIKVGKATIAMKKNGDISINGKKITIKGSGDVAIKGSKITQN